MENHSRPWYSTQCKVVVPLGYGDTNKQMAASGQAVVQKGVHIMGGIVFDKWVGLLTLESARTECQQQGYSFSILGTRSSGLHRSYHVQCYWIG